MKLLEMLNRALAQILLEPDQTLKIFTDLDLELQLHGVTSRALGEIINSLSQSGELKEAPLMQFVREIREREESIHGISGSIPTCHVCAQTLIRKGPGSYWCSTCSPPPARGT